MDTFPPPNKTAVVTGASSGIGRATCVALAAKGWNLTLTARRLQELRETEELVRGVVESGKTMLIDGDINDEAFVERLFAETMAAFGQIDVVFCNAGISTPAVSIAEVTLRDWNRAIGTNLTATFLCAREAFRYMGKGSKLGKGQGGRIVLNGSISAHVPRPNSSPYTSSKHGVSGLAKSLALDGRKHNIIVSQIDIGNAASDITNRMASGPGAEQADGSFKQEPLMDVKHAANEVVHIVEMPLSVNVQTVMIQASKMPSGVGRG